uniref:mRNA (guanine-N(7))-methyltransferase n=1 Tax=viral metagenome TaxID=1070528 RepID=A0A6C0BSJ1_9ZZZZ
MSHNQKMNFSNKYDMNSLTEKYLSDNIFDARTQKELEIRFSTSNPKDLTRMDYDNTIQKLLSIGFTSNNLNGVYMMRISNEFITQEGDEELSNIRAELNNFNVIQDYCKLENMEKLLEKYGGNPENINFVQKLKAKDEDGKILPVFNDEYMFKLSYQLEKQVTGNLVNKIVDSWTQTKKTFRYINRIRLSHPDFPMFVDISIVKSSSRQQKKPFRLIPQYSIEQSGVFTNSENYEIEIEIDEERVGSFTEYNSVDKLLPKMKTCIKYILSSLQGTNYPVSKTEMSEVLKSYMKLIHSKKKEIPYNITPKNFIGYSSSTLQYVNLVKDDIENMNSPNINNNYTVTDKADGERALLYINEKGKLYFIDSSMRVKFTGCYSDQKALYNTLVDGEYIEHNKYKESINLFACFDLYYLKGEDKRRLPLTDQEEDAKTKKGRLTYLRQLLISLKLKSITNNDLIPMRVEVKHFEIANKSKSIYNCCENLLKRISDPSYEYETDGLIFTPSNMGLPETDYKVTWDYSFKWKPSKYNTIDFLIKTKKTGNTDDINYLYNDGMDSSGQTDINSYKTLILLCGFDEKKHGYMNPCANVIEDDIGKKDNSEDNYKALPFYPTNPYDDNAYICNVMLKKDINGDMQMYTEENDLIEDNTIVEFRYDKKNENRWKWIPLRVRNDKTFQYRSRKGPKMYGNNYDTANSNWKSIHNPITEKMLMTGNGIPEEMADDDVYYRKTDTTNQTKRLKDFHNLYVKTKLITTISNVDDILIDVAVGKGGDLPKWIKSKLDFVFGIDLSPDNIENKLDGACVRYLEERKRRKRMPYCLFVNGNSSMNIRNTDAINSDKYKTITRAVFGDGPKDATIIGKGVFKHYGKGKNGFNITSCQFALHYFFENITILQQFLRNVCECTKVNGYFVATCYDGNKIFSMLERYKKGESITINKNSKKVWEIEKRYDFLEFKDDSSSVNYPICVYQDSIGKPAKEYLVNSTYLIRVMENYGFRLINEQECLDLNIPGGTNSFETLFNKMNDELRDGIIDEKDLRNSKDMKDYEKQISFLNRYFVFKKIREVNAENVIIDDKYISKTDEEEKLTEFLEEQERIKKIKRLPYKLKIKQITDI